MILLTGATGKIGKELMGLFTDTLKHTNVRVLIRNAAVGAELKGLGFDVLVGSLEDQRIVEAAMVGVETAFLLVGNTKDQGRHEKQFVDVAVRSKVSRIVKLSSTGADTESPSAFRRFHGESERYIEASGINYTFIRPDFFMNLLMTCAPTIIHKNSIFLPMGSGKVGMVSPKNVAQSIHKVLTTAGHDKKTYAITGPQMLGFTEIAAIASTVLGRQISYIDVPAADFISQLISRGVPEWSANEIVGGFKLVPEDGEVSNDFFELSKTEAETVEQYIRNNISLFQA